MEKYFRLALAAATSLGFIACASTKPGSTTAATTGNLDSPTHQAAAPADVAVPVVEGIPPDPVTANNYRIGEHDLLKVEVFQVSELSSEERVSEDGTIVMPLIGPVKVGSLTPKEAEDRIAGLLGETYLQNPQVNIFVKEYASQKVTVTGSVKSPGVFPLTGHTTLLQAVALAGGVDELANSKGVILFRGNAGNARAYVLNLTKIQEGSLPDPSVVGDDRIVVPKSGSAKIIKNVTDTLRGFIRPM